MIRRECSSVRWTLSRNQTSWHTFCMSSENTVESGRYCDPSNNLVGYIQSVETQGTRRSQIDNVQTSKTNKNHIHSAGMTRNRQEWDRLGHCQVVKQDHVRPVEDENKIELDQHCARINWNYIRPVGAVRVTKSQINFRLGVSTRSHTICGEWANQYDVLRMLEGIDTIFYCEIKADGRGVQSKIGLYQQERSDSEGTYGEVRKRFVLVLTSTLTASCLGGCQILG